MVRMWIDVNVSSPHGYPHGLIWFLRLLNLEVNGPREKQARVCRLDGFRTHAVHHQETSKWKGGKKIAVSSNCLEMMLRRRNAGWVLVGERKGKDQDEGS